MANEEDKDENELKPTFRIRFTISNNSNSDTGFSNQRFFNYQESKHKCNHEVDDSNQKSTISSNSKQTSESEQKKKKLFEIVQPHNHKSSLFVNLSDTTNSNHQKHSENCLFISPDLNQFDPASPPSPSGSTICSRSPSFELTQGLERANLLTSISNSTGNILEDLAMSQGCNFINSMMSASRREVAPDSSNTSRRASSLSNLAVPVFNQAMNKSPSGNHLVIGISNETICDVDQTQTNSTSSNNRIIRNLDMTQPLSVDISQFNEDSDEYDSEYDFDDMLSSQELEDECKRLEDEVRIWEHKVAELERKRFDDEVPRSLIDKMIDQRARLRDLEVQLYKLDLELADEISMCPEFDDSKPSTSRFGSQIQPGQENTADILDAIPPSGSLQHQQYLCKASSGTDSSEYSQSPMFEQHKKHFIDGNDIQCQLYNNRLTEPQNYVDYRPDTRNRSPVRPNHFKGDLRCSRIIAPQDSTSTGSSDSPY